jgi:hypothetical protein
MLIAETGPVTERVRVREIDDDEGQWVVRIIRRGSGSVVTWRRAQMVLLSAQGMLLVQRHGRNRRLCRLRQPELGRPTRAFGGTHRIHSVRPRHRHPPTHRAGAQHHSLD